MFIDEVVVTFKSGKGGDGAATFHREKHVPFGGPNGADGGRGGDIILIADRHLRTLYDFKLTSRFDAEDGAKAAANQNGKDAKDLIIRLPVGTVVTDTEFNEILVDLNIDGMKYIICKGGKGGMGNLHFTNSVRQAPKFAQKGAPADEISVKLELKMLADAGLVGLPNAGKSTLLSQISRAKPKIANYPFTTLTPNLGVVYLGDKSFVVADLPGLIEGASEGHGLGHQFLKHTERTKVLVHIVDAFPIDETDPWENYLMIEAELEKYSKDLYNRPRVVALNKIDLQIMGDLEEVKAKFAQTGHPLFLISGVTTEGIEEMLWALQKIVEEEEGETESVVIAPVLRHRDDAHWEVVVEDNEYHVRGKRIERLVAMTSLENREALRYLHKRLEKIGVINRLRDMGAEPGSTIVIDNWVFEFTDW